MSYWEVSRPRVSPPHYTCPYTTSPTLFMPLSLLKIAEKGREVSTEFILYAKANVEKENKENIIVREDYCVPRQTATTIFVEATPGDCKGYNVVIHKHPEGVSSFSATDHESINANNDVSILLEKGRVTEVEVRRILPCGAMANIRVPNEKIVFYIGNPKEFKKADEIAENVIREVKEKLTVAMPTPTPDDYTTLNPLGKWIRR